MMSLSELTLKIHVIGEEQTGKSNLISRFINDSFKEHHQTTIAPTSQSKLLEVENKKILFQVWDTPGREAFRKEILKPKDFENPECVIAVFDRSKPETFETAKNMLLDYSKYTEAKSFILVANKKDLKDSKKIKKEEIFDFAKQFGNGLTVKFVSAKKGVEIEEIFQSSAKQYLDYFEPQNENKSEKTAKNIFRFLSPKKTSAHSGSGEEEVIKSNISPSPTPNE